MLKTLNTLFLARFMFKRYKIVDKGRQQLNKAAIFIVCLKQNYGETIIKPKMDLIMVTSKTENKISNQMKKLILAIALFSASLVVLESCSPKTSTGAAAVRKGDVTGNWMLNNITFEGIPDVAVRGFLGEDSYKCFVGSTWRLTNSGNGSYSLPTSANCAAKTQDIFWSMSSADETFQFKKLYEGDKARNVTEGYRLVLAGGNGDSMMLKSPIEYSGRTAYVVLNFVKAVN
jgi:hypothetical protein